METEGGASQRERYIIVAIIAALLGTALAFRLLHLGSIPGINGDEGWWGVQSTHWAQGLAYEAKTTSGNPVDMAFLVPLGLLHRIAGPSFFVLRLLPAVANLLAIGLGFFLVRRLYGVTTASITTVALAIAPTAIAHSRFCQDPSQSILWTSVTMYLALLALREPRRWWIYGLAALLAFGMAFWTHPTNVFIAPFLVLPLWPLVQRWIPASRRGRFMFIAVAAMVVLAIALIMLFVVWPALKSRAGSSILLDKPWLTTASARVADPDQWFEYIRNYGRLFSGVTVYRYLSNPHLHAAAYGASTVLVAIAVIAGVVMTTRRHRLALDRGLVFGWAGMWIGYFLFAGPESIRPHVERWGLVLIPPAMLLIGRGVTGWIERGPRIRWATIGCATVVAAALVGSFYRSYFHEFQTTGGRSHRTFITAATEPKLQAIAYILASRSGNEPVTIVANDWWQFWPIAYLAQAKSGVTVRMTLPPDPDAEMSDAIARGRLYFVEFVGTPELQQASDWAGGHRLQFATTTMIKNAGGRDVFAIYQVTR